MKLVNDNLLNNPGRELKRNIWLKIENYKSSSLLIERFQIGAGECWCIVGNNRSGLDDFIDLLAQDKETAHELSLHVPENFAVLSFHKQQERFEAEQQKRRDSSEGKREKGTTVKELLANKDAETMSRSFGIDHLWEQGLNDLSFGETRKVMLVEAATLGSRHLLLQNPYEGLDKSSCLEFDSMMRHLLDIGFEIVLAMNSIAQLPRWCSHVAVLEKGHLIRQGEKEMVAAGYKGKDVSSDWSVKGISRNKPPEDIRNDDVLVSLKNGHARYGENLIFSGVDLLVETGTHTIITGPNGSGKSTLLSIISGDHPDCYTNNLHIFGIRRGSGESVWDLKKRMGIVSPGLHRNHYVPGNVLQIVVSGFFDSIGLYCKCSFEQKQEAKEWLRRLNLEDIADKPFRSLSFGEQRLVLVARALIKLPELLILDEPTQGLDDAYRNSFLSFLENIARQELSTILYVSHRVDEYREFFTQQLDMMPYNNQKKTVEF